MIRVIRQLPAIEGSNSSSYFTFFDNKTFSRIFQGQRQSVLQPGYWSRDMLSAKPFRIVIAKTRQTVKKIPTRLDRLAWPQFVS
jgi:hypothetical protein